MKKWLLGAGIAAVAIGLVVGGAAFAASRAPDGTADGSEVFPYPSPMGGRFQAQGQGGRGAFGDPGELHSYMLQAIADSLDLTLDDLESKLAEGQSLLEVAAEQGVTEESLPAVLEEARAKSLQAAVADGVLTQEQADWMAQHSARSRLAPWGMMSGSWGYGIHRGPMGGPMGGGFFGRR
jgi:hypothetical protein